MALRLLVGQWGQRNVLTCQFQHHMLPHYLPIRSAVCANALNNAR